MARKGMGGGMPGGMDMNKLLKQAQQMQTEMMQAQESLKDEIVEASAGGGMVANGGVAGISPSGGNRGQSYFVTITLQALVPFTSNKKVSGLTA